MPEFIFTAPDGTKHRVSGPEGSTEAEAFQVLQQRLGNTQSAAPAAVPEQPSLADDAVRGLGLGARTVGFSPARTMAGISDLAASALNIPIAGFDKLGQFLGDEPLDVRLPTNARATLDAQLDQFLPAPETMVERAGELAVDAVTGGTSAASLLSRAPQAIAAPQTVRAGLADDIAGSFQRNPGTFVASEAGGGAGAQIGIEATEESDNPIVQTAAPILTGLAGAVAPAAVTGVARTGLDAAGRALEPISRGGAERRVSRALQSRSDDPTGDAARALDAPEGVTPARATGNDELIRVENTAFADEHQIRGQIAADNQSVQNQALDDLADAASGGTDRAAWQQTVVQRAAPEGAEIRPGHPDEMLRQASDAFDGAYDNAKGFPIATRSVNVEGGDVPLRESFARSSASRGVIADKKWRTGVRNFLDGLLDDVERGAGDTVDSARMLEMRSTIRAELRRKSRSTTERAQAEARLLQNAENAVTDVLESQLPPEASAALKATDDRYRDFITVNDAVARSGEKGLTPEALRRSIAQREPSKTRVAQGDTGDLGQLAEQGKDVTTLMGKGRDDEIERVVRSMTPEQSGAVRSDMVRSMMESATKQLDDGTSRVGGEGLVQQIARNRDSLRAAGADDAELKRLDRIAQRIAITQKDVSGEPKVFDDALGSLTDFLSRVSGARLASNLARRSGTGSAGVLTTTGFFRRKVEGWVKKLNVAFADEVLVDAVQDKELFAALLVKGTDSPARQRQAIRTLDAWLAQAATRDAEDE